jgi:Thermostable hemolysin
VQILVVSSENQFRAQVERFIADVYREHYAASLTSFPPDLIAMFGEDGECVCAAGLRYAHTGFFSECYLDVPVEQALSRATRKAIDRSNIFEVTGLASSAPRAATRFLRRVVAYGELAGFDWAFFTATQRLRELLNRIDLPPLALAVADPRRVANAETWGSYYASTPIVCAVGRGTASTFLSRQAPEAAYA